MGNHTLDTNAAKRVISATRWVEQYSGQVTEDLGNDNRSGFLPPSSDPLGWNPRPPIQAVLLQDVSRGDDAAAAVLCYTRTRNNFALLLMGALDLDQFKFKLQLYGINGGNQSLLGTTAEMGTVAAGSTQAGEVTSKQMTDAIVDTRVFTREEVQVSLGNPFWTNVMIRNQDLAMANLSAYVEGETIAPTYLGLWFITILTDRYQSRFTHFEVRAFDQTIPGMLAIQRTRWIWGGQFERVSDVNEVVSPTPLRRGSKISCIDFPEVGYGIIGCTQREFFLQNPPD